MKLIHIELCFFVCFKEILEQVMVKNLDTGEAVPLSVAEEKLPKCTNPLALQIMRLTSEFHRYHFQVTWLS